MTVERVKIDENLVVLTYADVKLQYVCAQYIILFLKDDTTMTQMILSILGGASTLNGNGQEHLEAET